jgi:hypothetical protein
MTDLGTLMRETVGDQRADLFGLVAEARARGSVLRRRRRLAAAGSSMAVVTVIGLASVTGTAFFAGGERTPPTVAELPGVALGPRPAPPSWPGSAEAFGLSLARSLALSPIAPGGVLEMAGSAPVAATARALRAAAMDLSPERAAGLAVYRARSSSSGRSTRVAVLQLRADDTSPAGVVWLLSQRTVGAAEESRMRSRLSRCTSRMDSCSVSMPPDGRLLRTATVGTQGTTFAPSGPLVVADRLCGGVVLSLGAYATSAPSSTNAWPERSPFTPAQLGHLAELVATAAGHQPPAFLC